MNNHLKIIPFADHGVTEVDVGVDPPQCGTMTVTASAEDNLREREYVRLSIDQYIWDHHGRYGIDYPPEKYSAYQTEASEELDRLFVRLLKRNKAQALDEDSQAPRRSVTIVLDYSFATKADRDKVKEIVEREGGRWILVYFAISESRPEIRERVRGRKSKRDAESGNGDGDNAFDVTDEVLDTYFATFQVPRGEGETVIR